MIDIRTPRTTYARSRAASSNGNAFVVPAMGIFGAAALGFGRRFN